MLMIWLLAVSATGAAPECPAAPRAPRTAGSNPVYPAEALRQRMEGTTGFAIDVSIDGCVVACRVEESSGHPLLDEQTCPVLLERARFRQEVDAAGNPKQFVYRNKFVWRLPGKGPARPAGAATPQP